MGLFFCGIYEVNQRLLFYLWEILVQVKELDPNNLGLDED
jgi:hypothetical protein